MSGAQVRSSRAWWVTALILIGLACAYYFGWPFVGAYWNNTSLKGILKAHARQCAQDGKEACIPAIQAKALGELGIDLGAEELVLTHVGTNKVVYKISYRAKLQYPFTGTMFGSGKDRYTRFSFTSSSKLSGY